ncbi:hypothetical protein D3C81_931070 [compost metagenome]
MSFSRHQKIKKTRVDHICFGCMRKIPIGSAAHYHVGVFEGDFCADYFCNSCWNFLEVYPDYFEDGFYFGDIIEAKNEMERNKEIKNYIQGEEQ